MAAFRSRLAFSLAAGALLPAALFAQQSTGSLSGRITTADGVTPKAGVSVTLIMKGTNFTRKVVSDASGNWRVPALPVGDYRLVLEAGGQTNIINRSVNLGMDTLVRFKWPAEVGAVVVVEAVSGGVDQVNTTSAETGVNVDQGVLAVLPVIDRNVNSAAVLAPGVQIVQGSQVDPTKKTSTYIVSGDGQGRGTNFNVDGADNNSSDVGGYVLPIPFDAIDQFQVVTNQYKAEFGRSNAGFLNVVTKSGTNAFKGSATAQYSNDALRARKTDEGTKGSNTLATYSVLVSGPILPDKLFYMVAAEESRASNPSYTFDPRAITAYPQLGGITNKVVKDNIYMKVDWNVNQMWTASFKYARYYDSSSNQGFPHTDLVAGFVSPYALGTNRDSTTSYGVKLTGSFGAMVWESTFNTFDYINSIRPSFTGANMSTNIETRSIYTATQDAWRSGQDPNAWQNTGVKRLQWKNELTWTLPNHNVKGGLDWQKTTYPFEQYFFNAPSPYVMSLAGVTFGQEWSNTVQADTNVVRVLLAVPFDQPGTDFKGYGIYLQDDWTLNNKLNLYYGGRVDWDTQLDYYSQFDSMYQQIHAANPGLAGIGDRAPRTHKYFSPRLQLLYKPNGDDNLTLKLGLGRFVASTIDNVVGFSRQLNGPVNGMPGTGSYIYNNAALVANGKPARTPAQGDGLPSFQAGTTLAYAGADAFPITLPADLTPYNYANNIAGLRTLFETTLPAHLGKASFATGGKQLLATDFTYPTTDTLTLGMVYKFSERSNVDLTLVYSKTRHQTVQMATDGATPQTTSLGPDPALGDMGDLIFLSNQTSTSRQLQVKYAYTTPRMSFLATFVAKYSTSSYGGDGTAFGNNGGADFYGAGTQYPWVTNPERTTSGTEAFSGAFAWAYKFDFGTDVSLLGQWHSGKYYDVYLGNGALAGPGGSFTTSDPNLWLGNRVGDWNMDLGLRIAHTLKFGRKLVVEPYVQVQNLLNNYDYGNNYDNNLNDSNGDINTHFGQRNRVFQANSPRTAAFGVKLAF